MMQEKKLFSKRDLLDQLKNNKKEFLDTILEANKPLYERKGHALQKHMDMTPEKMLNRLLMEGKSAISTFGSIDEMHQVLEVVLKENANEITRVQNGIIAESYFDKTICLPYAGSYICNDLKEYVTPFSYVAIRNDPTSQFGFYVETIYAREPKNESENPYIRQTGRFFRNDDIYYGININRDPNSQIRWYLEHEKHIPVRQIETGDLYVDIRKRSHHFRVLISDGEIQKYIRTIPGVSVRTGDSVRADSSDRRSQQLLKEFRKECPELQQIKEDIAEFVRSLKAHERGYGGMGLHKVEISVDQEQYQNYMRDVLMANGELERPIYNGFDSERKLYLFDKPVILNGIIHATFNDIPDPRQRGIVEEFYAVLFPNKASHGSGIVEGIGNELQGIPPDLYEKIAREQDRSLIQQEVESVSEQDRDLYHTDNVRTSRSDDVDLWDER